MYDHIAHYYDLSHNRLESDITFLVEQAALAGSPLLELGCGSGRLMVPLARAGHIVTGVDQSEAMLARARFRLATEPAAVRERCRFVTGDMTSFVLPPVDKPFGLVYFGYNTFMHLDETLAGRTMRHIRPLIRPGGRLLLDLDNPLILAAAIDDPDFALEDRFTDPATNQTIYQYTAYEAILGQQAVDVTWIYKTETPAADEPVQVKSTMRYHYLYPHQIELMVSLIGLRLEGLYGDYDMSPFHEDSERLLVVAVADR